MVSDCGLRAKTIFEGVPLIKNIKMLNLNSHYGYKYGKYHRKQQIAE